MSAVEAFHEDHPLGEGMPIATARRALDGAPADHRTAGADLLDALLDRLIQGRIARTGDAIASSSRRADDRQADPRVQEVVDAVSPNPRSRPP